MIGPFGLHHERSHNLAFSIALIGLLLSLIEAGMHFMTVPRLDHRFLIITPGPNQTDLMSMAGAITDHMTLTPNQNGETTDHSPHNLSCTLKETPKTLRLMNAVSKGYNIKISQVSRLVITHKKTIELTVTNNLPTSLISSMIDNRLTKIKTHILNSVHNTGKRKFKHSLSFKHNLSFKFSPNCKHHNFKARCNFKSSHFKPSSKDNLNFRDNPSCSRNCKGKLRTTGGHSSGNSNLRRLLLPMTCGQTYLCILHNANMLILLAEIFVCKAR